MTSLRILLRRAAAVVAALAGALLVLAPVARADGPGYGGTADRLSVSWSGGSSPDAAAGTPSAAGVQVLDVSGLGFRSRSAVVVQVGDHGITRTRTDAVGQVVLTVPATGRDRAPGTSVLATGRAPSGTTRVLVGAVPPAPSGQSPTQLVVTTVATVGAVLLAARVGVLGLRRARGARAAQAGSKR